MIEFKLPRFKPAVTYRASSHGRTTKYWNEADMNAFAVKAIKDTVLKLYKEGILKEQVIITADTKSALYPYLEEELDRDSTAPLPANQG